MAAFAPFFADKTSCPAIAGRGRVVAGRAAEGRDATDRAVRGRALLTLLLTGP